MVQGNLEAKIEDWLKKTLLTEDVTDVSFDIQGTNQKGDGYLGDIVFVEAHKRLKDGSSRSSSLVLKCSKKSQALRRSTPIKDIFENEIYLYASIIPEFQSFQAERGLSVFGSIAKYYGSLVDETMEIIAFENLKQSGFSLWDKRKPLPRGHIDMVVERYAELHALSMALQDQAPERFRKLVDGVKPVTEKMADNKSFSKTVEAKIRLSCEILKDDVDGKTLDAWLNFTHQTEFIMYEMLKDVDGVKVITHGDCWGNNFMYKHELTNNKIVAIDVRILDWQITKYTSPVTDLSYFLFASISEEDLRDLDTILDHYYASLSKTLKRLGSTAEEIYPYDTFMSDWKKYAKFGLAIVPVIYYICSTARDEVLDIGDLADDGKEFMDTFNYDLKDNTIFKSRMKALIPFVIENQLID